jgi:5-(carboxyamino)imidazole ribonucleotide synthase
MNAILPGSIVGVLGGGQLGRMFAIAARRCGYRVHTFSPGSDTPAGQIADREYHNQYEDLDAVREFARGVSVITFEFENVPARAVEAACEFAPVRPSGSVLHTAQNRLREKTFLARNNFPVTPFRHVTSLETLRAAAGELGYPAVLKTAGFGYDGKGQARLTGPEEVDAAFAALGGGDGVLEAFVAFEREVSVVAARTGAGDFTHYGVVENTHHRHILDLSVAPAPGVPEALAREAVEVTRSILDALKVVGVMCVEFFVAPGGRLLVNELAPRPHNSGHFTFDACVTSQFEQQLRAVCGLPLGSTELLRPAAMANLLGDLWESGEPDWEAALAHPEIKLHLYGKREPRAGRKMGHLTALAATPEGAARVALSARGALVR